MEKIENISPKQIPTEVVEDFVYENYGLERNGDSETISQGVESAVWLIPTTEGRWYAKVYGQHEGPIGRIQEETRLYDYLTDHGIRVPAVKASLDGKKALSITTEHGTYSTILMKYEEIIEPKPSTISQEELEKIAKTIARMHEVLKQYPNKDQLIDKNHIPSQVPTNVFQTLIDSPNKKIYTDEELEKIHELDKKMIHYLESNPVPDDLTETVLHGDLAFGHAQLLKSGDVYFFDFADRWYGPIAHELAILTQNLYRPEDISFERFEQLRNWLLTSYTTEGHLTPEDHKAMTPFILRNIMEAVRYLSQVAKKEGYDVDSKGIKRRYKLAEYLLTP